MCLFTPHFFTIGKRLCIGLFIIIILDQTAWFFGVAKVFLQRSETYETHKHPYI